MEQNVHRATSPSRQLAHKNYHYEAQSKHVSRMVELDKKNGEQKGLRTQVTSLNTRMLYHQTI